MPRNPKPHRPILLAALLACAVHHAVAGQPDAMERLAAAYPGQFGCDNATIVWRDGTRIPFGAERPGLTFDQRIDSATLWDQLSIPYPREWPVSPPLLDADPGRLRCDAFFRKMYGATAADVERNLVRVPWPAAGAGKTVRFTNVNGVNKALEAVGTEVAKLPETVCRYVARPNGTFNWRPIAGTERLSPHSYGIAIDFEMPFDKMYWRWDSKKGNGSRNVDGTSLPNEAVAYPVSILGDRALQQIVDIFERHGFIWGGKWYHYDLMHFEYRPELLALVRN